MTQTPNNNVTDLRGITHLAVDGVIGTTKIVESLHQTIESLAGILADPNAERTRGITGLVYRNILTVTELIGAGIDVPLAQLSGIVGETQSSSGRESILAALNGILGDHLVARNNPLAIPMQFRQNGQALTKQTFVETVQQANGRLLIMVHGLCMNDLQWLRQDHDHGVALARDLDMAPLYLHYNTGLHISENGREFADLMESLVEQSPQPLEFVIIGHSMGGLVARSACYYGAELGHTWLTQLQKMIFLGTPHHGAPIEKGGNWIDFVLDVNPYSAPFSRLGKVRSGGVTDLRYGNVVEEDWQDRDRFQLAPDQRVPVPLPEGVACYAIAATTRKEFNVLGEDIIGDGLVMVSSALGWHQTPEFRLAIPKSQQWVGQDMNHWDLLTHPDVYAHIKNWLEN